MKTITLAAALAIVGMLGGCNMNMLGGQKIAADQPIRIEVEETSGENPVHIVLKVDDQTVFDYDLPPGRPRYPQAVHSPDSPAGPRLAAGRHRISWQIHRNGPMGKVGHGQVTVCAGGQVLAPTFGVDNSRMVMPYFSAHGWVDFTLEAAGGATDNARPMGAAMPAPAPPR